MPGALKLKGKHLKTSLQRWDLAKWLTLPWVGWSNVHGSSQRAKGSGWGRLDMLVLIEEGRFEGFLLVGCIFIAVSEWHLESNKDIILTLNQGRSNWAYPTVSVGFFRTCFYHVLCRGWVDSNDSQCCEGVWLPRWRKSPPRLACPAVALDLPTTIFSHLQGVPKTGLPGAAAHFTPSPLVRNVEHRAHHGLRAVEKKSISVAGIWCLRKSKYGTYVAACTWERWGKRQNSPDSLMSSAPQPWMKKFANEMTFLYLNYQINKET